MTCVKGLSFQMVFESISGEGKSYQDVIHFIVCRSQVQIFY